MSLYVTEKYSGKIYEFDGTYVIKSLITRDLTGKIIEIKEKHFYNKNIYSEPFVKN